MLSVYNRTVMTPQSLPHVVDEAIKAAYEHKGVAIVTIPVDLGFALKSKNKISRLRLHTKPAISYLTKKICWLHFLTLKKAKKPVLYVGQGTRNGFEQIKHFSEHFSVPVVASVLAKGIVPDSYKNFLGFCWTSCDETCKRNAAEADLILFVGSDFPFGRAFFNPDAAFIQIDIDASKFGPQTCRFSFNPRRCQHHFRRLAELGQPRPEDRWYLANQKTKRTGSTGLKSFEDREEQPIRPEAVYKEINRIAKDDAIFV